jgi:hypothetical protein
MNQNINHHQQRACADVRTYGQRPGDDLAIDP